MTDDPDLERLLHVWFDDGPTSMPDRVATAVADRTAGLSQRPTRRDAWRPTSMNDYPKLILGAAAVLVLAVLGYTTLNDSAGQPSTGGPLPSVAPTPTIAPTSPTPGASASGSPAYVWPGALDAGTYTTRFIWDIPFELRFTVQDGWQSRDVEIIKPGLSVAFLLAGNTYRDPCLRLLQDPPTGPTVDDLAAALTSLPEFDTTATVPVSLDGVAGGRYLELVVRPDLVCGTPGLWADPPDSYNGSGPQGPPAWGAEYRNLRLWILDVDGIRIVVNALWSDIASDELLEELDAVIESIRIVPASGPPVPLPSPG